MSFRRTVVSIFAALLIIVCGASCASSLAPETGPKGISLAAVQSVVPCPIVDTTTLACQTVTLADGSSDDVTVHVNWELLSRERAGTRDLGFLLYGFNMWCAWGADDPTCAELWSIVGSAMTSAADHPQGDDFPRL